MVQTHEETFFLERWKEVPGFPNYEASTHGRLRNKTTKKELRGYTSQRGYIRVYLKKKHKQLHRLVAETWIYNADANNKCIVDHINRVRDDNRAINLRWASYQQQNKNKTTGQTAFKRAVRQICLETNKVLRTFESIVDAGRHMGKMYGGSISHACNGRLKTAYGFKWAYVPDRECTNERWKPIPQHPTYHFSTYGRLKNKYGVINDYVKCSRSSHAYPTIEIQGKSYLRHVLLGDLFIGKPSKNYVYNHIDSDKWNCHIDNLEVCTQSANTIHAYENGRNPSTRGVEVTCMKNGKKRKFRSMRHASIEGFNKNHSWLQSKTKMNKQSTFEYQGHIINIAKIHKNHDL